MLIGSSGGSVRHPLGRPRRRRRARPPSTSVGPVVGVEVDDPLERRAVGRGLLDHRAVVAGLELGRRDQQPHARLVDGVGELVGAVGRVDVDQDRADLRGGVLGERPLGAVRRPDADPVALGDAGRRSARARTASTSRSSSGPGPAPAGRELDQRLAVGVGRDRRARSSSPIVCSSSGGSSSPLAYDSAMWLERTPGWLAVGRVCGVTSTDADPSRVRAEADAVQGAPRDRAPAGVRDHPRAGRQDVLRPVVLHPLGVDGARAHRQRPDPGAEAVVLGQRRAAARRRHRLRRPGRLAQRSRVRPADVVPGARAGQDRPVPDRRAPGEARHRRRRRHHRVLRRRGPDHGQRRAHRRGATSSSPRRTRRSPATARCPAARWTATGPPGRSRPAPCS